MPVDAVTATCFLFFNSCMMFLKCKTICFLRVAEHIYKDAASSVSTEFLYGQYKLYVSANDNVLAKAEKTKFGQIIKRLMDHPPLHQKMINGLKTNWYHRINIVTASNRDILPEKNRLLLNTQMNFDIDTDNKLHTITYPTLYTFDDKPLNTEFTISDENNMTWVTVRDLNMEITEMIGIHFKSCMDQCWVDGTAILADKMELCKGRSIYFHLESTVPQYHTQNILTGDSWASVHSKNCELVLPFTKTKRKWLCDHCVHDLGYV